MEKPTSSSKTGRGTKLTPEVAGEICSGIAAGLSDGDACLRAGISGQSLLNWKKRGAEGEEPYAAFVADLHEAEIQFKLHHLKNISVRAKRNWQASAWLLERKFPQEFGQKQKVEFVDQLSAWVEAFDKL